MFIDDRHHKNFKKKNIENSIVIFDVHLAVDRWSWSWKIQQTKRNR